MPLIFDRIVEVTRGRSWLRAAGILAVIGCVGWPGHHALAQPETVEIQTYGDWVAVNDTITLESRVLQSPPYNSPPGRYELRFFVCENSPALCPPQLGNWHQMQERDARGNPASSNVYVCRSGPCRLVVRETSQTARTYRAVLVDTQGGSRRIIAMSRAAEINWNNTPRPTVRIDGRSVLRFTLGAAGGCSVRPTDSNEGNTCRTDVAVPVAVNAARTGYLLNLVVTAEVVNFPNTVWIVMNMLGHRCEGKRGERRVTMTFANSPVGEAGGNAGADTRGESPQLVASVNYTFQRPPLPSVSPAPPRNTPTCS